MTKAQKKKYITELIEKWRPILFLGEWSIVHSLSSDIPPDADTDRPAAAEVSVSYTYKLAEITIYDGFWTATKETQDLMICHELCHCHTQELFDFCTDFQNGKYHTPEMVLKAVETLTQRVSLIAKYGHL